MNKYVDAAAIEVAKCL